MTAKSAPKQLKNPAIPHPDAAGVEVLQDTPFWQTKTLDEMSQAEWEQLCDGCGQCCLIKLEDEDTGDIAVTRLSCRLLDIGSCRCKNYENRKDHVSDCVTLTPGQARELTWLPETCAYRLLAHGEPLSWWHPLVSGSSETVHEAGISVRSYAISEEKIAGDDVWKYIRSWIARKSLPG